MASVTLSLITVLGALTPLSVAADKLQDVLFNGNYGFIDLTHYFNNDTVSWPGDQNFQFTKKTEKKDSESSWYAANDFSTGEHAGTHLDAPYHFHQPGTAVGNLRMDKLIVPCKWVPMYAEYYKEKYLPNHSNIGNTIANGNLIVIIVDVSSKVKGNPGYVLYKDDLGDSIKDSRRPSLLVFRFGWSKYFNHKRKFLGLNGLDNIMNFPGLSKEVAEIITTSYTNIVGVGVDTASVDPGASTDFAVHKIFAKAGLYNLENLNLHRHISNNKCTALVMPMKIQHGTGAPLRLVAICPKKSS